MTNAAQPQVFEMPSKDHMLNGHSKPKEQQPQPETTHQHIWLITGPAGCGKSTVAEYIANALSLPYLEGDNVSACLPLFLPHSSFQFPPHSHELKKAH